MENGNFLDVDDCVNQSGEDSVVRMMSIVIRVIALLVTLEYAVVLTYLLLMPRGFLVGKSILK